MSKSLYFLIYVNNGKRSELTLREPTLDSKDFIRIRGERASEIFNSIMTVLNAYTLKYNVSKSCNGNNIIVELPADVGYAILIYLLLTYNAREPKKWLHFLEKLLAGKIPLSNYLNVFVNMAIDLSELKSYYRSSKTVVKPYAAKMVSSMLRTFARNIIQA